MSSMVQIDNEDVRVTRWTLDRDEETGPHRHEYDYVVVPLVSARMWITNSEGVESLTELTPGASYFREAGAEHNVRNVDDAIVNFVEVEIVRPTPATPGTGTAAS